MVQYPSKYLHGMPTIIANNKTEERYTKIVLKQFIYFPYQKPIDLYYIKPGEMVGIWILEKKMKKNEKNIILRFEILPLMVPS